MCGYVTASVTTQHVPVVLAPSILVRAVKRDELSHILIRLQTLEAAQLCFLHPPPIPRKDPSLSDALSQRNKDGGRTSTVSVFPALFNHRTSIAINTRFSEERERRQTRGHRRSETLLQSHHLLLVNWDAPGSLFSFLFLSGANWSGPPPPRESLK